MSDKYLLPCSCGQKIPVTKGQSGGQVACACGAMLDVPTLMELTALEPAEADNVSRDTSGRWGIRQRLILIGLIVFLMGLGPGVYVFGQRPAPPNQEIDPDRVQEQFDRLTPLGTWRVWHVFMETGLQRRTQNLNVAYEEALTTWWLRFGTSIAVAGVGLALVLVGVVVVPQSSAETGEASDNSAIDADAEDE